MPRGGELSGIQPILSSPRAFSPFHQKLEAFGRPFHLHNFFDICFGNGHNRLPSPIDRWVSLLPTRVGRTFLNLIHVYFMVVMWGNMQYKTVFSCPRRNLIWSPPTCLHFWPHIHSGSLHEHPVANLELDSTWPLAVDGCFLGLQILPQDFQCKLINFFHSVQKFLGVGLCPW